MYKEFFALTSNPFGVTPDERFYYESGTHHVMLAQLRRAVESRRGLMLVTGPPGSGKTLLAKRLLRDLGEVARVAHLFEPLVDFDQALRLTLRVLGIRNFTVERSAMLNRLQRHLSEQFSAGRLVCLVIDEAQDCSMETLNGLKWLSNLETENDKLLQIILLGECELEERLDRAELSQLRRRIAFRCRLEPLTVSEVDNYIAWRLQVADYRGPRLFDAAALERIAKYSQGIPRLINIVCDHALEAAVMAAQSVVRGPMIDKVVREQGFITAAWQQSSGASAADRPLPWQRADPLIESVVPNDEKFSPQQEDFKFDSDYGVVDADGRPLGSDRHGRGWASGVCAVLILSVAGAAVAALYYPDRTRDSLAALIEAVAPKPFLEMLNVELPWAFEERLASLGNPTSGDAAKDKTARSGTPHEQQIGVERAVADLQQSARELGAAESPNELWFKRLEEPSVTKASPSQPPPASRTATRRDDNLKRPRFDENLEARVSKAMLDRALDGVEVSVRAGTVTLGGRVATLRQKLLAGRVARTLVGAEFVQNEIIVDWSIAPSSQ